MGARYRRQTSVKILLSVPADLKERMINTILETRSHTGISHQQKFIRAAIVDLCDRLENEFNAGKAFQAAETSLATKNVSVPVEK